ncbi:MAG: ASKHA domain-containing protein [Oscillospiraceae bacterium]|nr:ASKHA domain-containing protein [Oscillospiraceae bacterium]
MTEHTERGGTLEEQLVRLALSCGAADAAAVSSEQIKTDPMFRDICRGNGCGNYSACWMCPPDIGDIAALIGEVRRFPKGVLYQTVSRIADSFDFEGMMAAGAAHAQMSVRLNERLGSLLPPGFLHLTCGGCRLCQRCARRDGAPCRHPKQALASMEGYGIDVYTTSRSTPLPYIHGEGTVTYFGLVLYEDSHILRVIRDGAVRQIRFSGTPLLQKVLSEYDLLPPRPCGGRGTCGKCTVELTGEISPPNEAERKAGARLACQAMLLGDGEVRLENSSLEQVETGCHIVIDAVNPMPGQVGAAVDIGTTTVVLRLFDLPSGRALAQAAMLNPQTDTAADVIGRIDAALKGGLPRLRGQIEGAVFSLLEDACGQAGCDPAEVCSMVATGNTAMLYLLTGQDPACLARVPFRADTLFGISRTSQGRTVYLPPCMDAFVGGDITCAILASGMCRSKEAALLCDMGTNGEIALWLNSRLYVASTAAGPAFEGAGISCGCGSVRGAVDQVWLEDEQIQIHTLGDESPVGICGSGLVDAVAVFLATGALDPDGMAARELRLHDDVVLQPQDISAVQLAKAAIAAGVDTLLEYAGGSYEQIAVFYIAGGFGSRLNIENAAAIGLIHPALRDKARVIGNAALTGASRLLLDQGAVREAASIAAQAEPVPLSGDPVFENYYMERLLFP